MAVPYTFATASGTLPLNQLDSNFATLITLGTSTVGLGASLTSISGLTLTGVTLTGSSNLGTPTSLTLTNATGLPLGGTGVTGTLGVANGGTGLATLSTNNVLLGNGTSAVQAVAPGTTGNILASNGTTWTSSTPATSGIVTNVGTPTSGQIGIWTGATTLQGQTVLGVANGGTGSTTSTGTVGTANVLATSPTLVTPIVTALNGGQLAGFRNRFINGNMSIDQRNSGASQSITAGAYVYTVDRWFASSTGGTVTGQQTVGSGNTQYRYQLTGAAGVTAITFGQRIAQSNSYELSGQTVTLSVDLANSTLTTISWSASYANSADSFGTLASPTVTSIATGSFTVTSTVTRYNAQITIPSAATTGIQILLSVGAQTSGTWTIGNVQLEPGNTATPFETRMTTPELAMCQRYYFSTGTNSIKMLTYADTATALTPLGTIFFPVSMRTNPLMAYSTVSISNSTNLATDFSTNQSISTRVTSTAVGVCTAQFSYTASAEI